MPVMDAISNAAGSTGANLRTVGPCDQQGGILEKGNVSGAVQGLAADQAHVVVVCAHDVGGVAEEMQLLSELMVGLASYCFVPECAVPMNPSPQQRFLHHEQGALNAMNRQHTVMYLSEPKPERPTGRLLQENAATSCDSECYVSVPSFCWQDIL